MSSPGKPSPGKSVPVLSDEQVSRLARRHHMVDPTRYLYGPLHHPNEKEIREQNPVRTARLLEGVAIATRMRSHCYAYGVEHIPDTGVFITAATHVTQMDVFVPMETLFHLGRRPRFMAKAELSKWPWVGNALACVGMQPVVRRGGKSMAEEVEEQSIQILTSGRPLTIFPEGTVTRDPQKWPMSLKPGMAYIALGASERLGYQVPIFPAVTWGGASINNWWPWPRKNIVEGIGNAVDYSDLLEDADSWDGEPPRASVDELSERVRRAMERIMSEIRGENPPQEGMWDYKTESRVPRPAIREDPQEDDDETKHFDVPILPSSGEQAADRA